MRKIISLFARNYDGDRFVRDEVVAGAEWVVSGEGIATRKYDGTACLVKDGKLFKRYDVKKGRTAPSNFIPAQEADQVTGHWPGWIPVGDGNEDRWHREAFAKGQCIGSCGHFFSITEGTYELCGPKIQSNPEGLTDHYLVAHGKEEIANAPRDFAGLRDYFKLFNLEGIVWHHPDGRMVKIKRKDFGP